MGGKKPNIQMQQFDRRSPKIRGKRLLEEMAHALNNPKLSGVKSTKDVFNDPEWIQSFDENWRKYASGDDWKTIFDNSSNNISQ